MANRIATIHNDVISLSVEKDINIALTKINSINEENKQKTEQTIAEILSALGQETKKVLSMSNRVLGGIPNDAKSLSIEKAVDTALTKLNSINEENKQEAEQTISEILSTLEQIDNEFYLRDEIVCHRISDIVFHSEQKPTDYIKKKLYSLVDKLCPHDCDKQCECWWREH
jgi:GTPase